MTLLIGYCGKRYEELSWVFVLGSTCAVIVYKKCPRMVFFCKKVFHRISCIYVKWERASKCHGLQLYGTNTWINFKTLSSAVISYTTEWQGGHFHTGCTYSISFSVMDRQTLIKSRLHSVLFDGADEQTVSQTDRQAAFFK